MSGRNTKEHEEHRTGVVFDIPPLFFELFQPTRTGLVFLVFLVFCISHFAIVP